MFTVALENTIKPWKKFRFKDEGELLVYLDDLFEIGVLKRLPKSKISPALIAKMKETKNLPASAFGSL